MKQQWSDWDITFMFRPPEEFGRTNPGETFTFDMT